ncbi:Concanavalin A-like lectin/glucanases superfamily protein [Lachnospiraceae bacterium]|nr:Concanavalin A-like lectin/glucanases superfamily protein [Lachnospiraceae bacterium]
MYSRWKRRAMGVALSAVMTLSSLQLAPVTVSAAETKELLHLTFDDETDGLKSNGYTAKIVGSGCEFREDDKYGKVLSLGGKGYLKVTDEDGNSPLNGLDKATVNYYSKPSSGVQKGWTLFAVRDDETPVYLDSEHYIGVMDLADSVTAERHLCEDGKARPAALKGSANGEWRMVTVVYEEGKTTLYINGKKVSEEASEYKLTDILKDNSAFNIGKANWAGGEYYSGKLEDYSVYAGALSDEEIAKLYVDGKNPTEKPTEDKPQKEEEEENEDPVLNFDFESSSDGKVTSLSGNYTASLEGNAKITEDGEKGNVLSLDGNSSYLELPKGFFDGRDVCTISFDMKPSTVAGNFFNFTVGLSNSKYYYLRSRSNSTYMGITTDSWENEQGLTVTTDNVAGTWNHYDVVFDKDEMLLYINGELKGTKDISITFADLGSDLISYLGKSFYSGDAYVKGLYDDFKVYNRALSEEEVAKNANRELPLLRKITADDVTFVTQKIDNEKKEVTLYYSIKNTTGDVSKAKLGFNLLKGAEVVGGVKDSYDLTKPFTITVANDEKEAAYSVSAVACNNPALGGQYADPDIDCFDGKYYIYPTTDGYSGWSGYQFKVFSSEDLVNWKDEGVILDLKQDEDSEETNENGVKIASVPWSNGSAWAPSIEEKDGRYYFYFCGHDTTTNAKAIGVASADSPVGPFTVNEKPLISIKTCNDAGISMGQAIDPSVFKDDDGSYWLSFGNGKAAIVKLNDDMTSIDASTMQNVTGLNEFRESLIITKRNGLYHYTWSCDDTGSENYHINYGTSEKLGGRVTFRETILQKDADNDILGTGHHSILNVPGTDNWYIAYARFMTPLGQISNGYGYHREVCIDKLSFDADGYMEKVQPTNEGITEAVPVNGFGNDDPSDPGETPGKNDPTGPSDPGEIPGNENTGNGAAETNVPKAPVNNVITGDNAVLCIGNKYTVDAGFKVKTFKVSDKKVLKVSKKGKVSVKKAGTVTITAKGTAGEEKTFSNIVVEKPVMKSITVKETDTVELSQMLSGITYAVPDGYKSSNSKVASIDEKGKIVIKGKGKTSITVTFGKKKFRKTLKVK